MKKEIEWFELIKCVLLSISAVLLFLTPKFNDAANLERIRAGYGGECFLWVMPILGLLVATAVKETIEEGR